jgi:hypothetical protein
MPGGFSAFSGRFGGTRRRSVLGIERGTKAYQITERLSSINVRERAGSRMPPDERRNPGYLITAARYPQGLATAGRAAQRACA